MTGTAEKVEGPSQPTASGAADAPVRSGAGRAVIALFIACIFGVGLLHFELTRRFAAVTAVREARATMILARAVAAIAESDGAEGEALRRDLQLWQREHSTVRAVRVINTENRTLEASSFAEDLAAGAPPRRLQRPEKPLFDLGETLRGNVEANRSEHSKREVEIAVVRRPGGSFLIAVPLEREGSVIGFTQIDGAPQVVAVEPPALWTPLLFLAVGLAVAVAIALATRLPRAIAIGATVVILLATIFSYRQWAIRTLVSGARAAESKIEERIAREAATATRIAPSLRAGAASWDCDEYRVPVARDVTAGVADEERAIANASYGIAAAALAIFLFVALGGTSRVWRALVDHRQAYAYVAPAMVGMLILVFFPFIYGVAISFTRQTIYTVNRPLTEIWSGLRNYAEILGDFDVIRHTAAGRAANYENFYWTLGMTVLWTIVNVTIGVTVGLLLALILNTKGLRAKVLYRVLLILPWAVPNYITALIWKGMFHRQFGVMNQIMAMFGRPQVSWFEHPLTAFIAVVATNGWLSFPFMMVVSLGALQSIPADLYESARVDGASRWQQFTAITLPSLKPALVPAVILSVVWTFNMFNIIYLVSAGEPAHSTEILITQAYKLAFEQYRYGYAAAYSTIIFAILLIYGVFQNRVTSATEAISS